MPPFQTRRHSNPATPPNGREKNGQGPLVAGVMVGGGALGAILWFLLRRKRAVAGEPAPGAVLVASTAPGQPEIS